MLHPSLGRKPALEILIAESERRNPLASIDKVLQRIRIPRGRIDETRLKKKPLLSHRHAKNRQDAPGFAFVCHSLLGSELVPAKAVVETKQRRTSLLLREFVVVERKFDRRNR